MLDFFLNAFFVGIISWMYHIVMRDKILSKWFLFGYRKFDSRNDWTYYFYEPIFNCEKCFAGQLALWSFFFFDYYSLYYHIAFIALSILFVTLITKWTN